MTSRDFCYWLQGLFEIGDAGNHPDGFILNVPQCKVIKKHLDMVFAHEIDPSFGKDNAKLNAIHNKEELRPRC